MKNLLNLFSYVFKNIVSLLLLLISMIIISTILLLDSGVLQLNTFDIQSIGSGIVIFSGSLFPLSTSSNKKLNSKSKHNLHWDNHILPLNNVHLLNKDLIKKGVNDFFIKKVGNILDENKQNR